MDSKTIDNDDANAAAAAEVNVEVLEINVDVQVPEVPVNDVRQGILTLIISEHEPCMFLESEPVFRRVITDSVIPIRAPRKEYDLRNSIKVPILRYETSFQKLISSKESLDENLAQILKDALFVIIELDARTFLKDPNPNEVSWSEYILGEINKKLNCDYTEMLSHLYTAIHQKHSRLQNNIFVIVNCIHLTASEYEMIIRARFLPASNRTQTYTDLVQRDQVAKKIYGHHIISCNSYASWNDGNVDYPRSFSPSNSFMS
jgi:hypothetical protein